MLIFIFAVWNPDPPGPRQPTSLFTPTIEHCLMGIRGTVRRSTDSFLVHCNVDTDVLIWEGDPQGEFFLFFDLASGGEPEGFRARARERERLELTRHLSAPRNRRPGLETARTAIVDRKLLPRHPPPALVRFAALAPPRVAHRLVPLRKADVLARIGRSSGGEGGNGAGAEGTVGRAEGMDEGRVGGEVEEEEGAGFDNWRWWRFELERDGVSAAGRSAERSEGRYAAALCRRRVSLPRVHLCSIGRLPLSSARLQTH